MYKKEKLQMPNKHNLTQCSEVSIYLSTHLQDSESISAI